MSMKLPDIISAGIFDSSQRCSDKKFITTNRVVVSFEIELPITHSCEICVNDKHHGVTDSQILCIKPGERRRTIGDYSCYYIHFSAEESDIYDFAMNLPTFTNVSNVIKVRDMFSNMIAAFNSTGLKNTMLLYSELLQLLNMIYKKDKKKTESNALGKDKSILNALEFLNDNYAYDIKLKDIADYVHLSPMYLRELFINKTGLSPHKYLLNKRIDRAKELLLMNFVSITEVASLSGFSSQSYFDYVFKKETGLTPKQFKIENNSLYFK